MSGYAHFPAALGFADSVCSADDETYEETLLADATRLALLLVGFRRGLGRVGTETRGRARTVHAHTAELNAEVGVERV